MALHAARRSLHRLHRLRRRLESGLSGRMRHRTAMAGTLVPQVLDGLADELGAAPDGWRLRALAHNPDGPLVLEAVAASGNACIVKLATDGPGAARLAAEADALRIVDEEPALSSWRSIVPRVLALRSAPEAAILVTTRLRGRPLGTRRTGPAPDPMPLAVAALAPLHTVTNEPRAIDDTTLDAWVRHPIDRLEAVLTQAGLVERPDRPLWDVEAVLADELRESSPWQSMVHGDFWLDNVLFDETGRVTGIVDWEAAATARPPAEDLVGLLMASRRAGTGRHTGEVAAELLAEVGSSTSSTSSTSSGSREQWLWDAVEATGIRSQPAILLAWLAAIDGSLQRRPSLARDRGWLRRNIEPVRLALQRAPHARAEG